MRFYAKKFKNLFRNLMNFQEMFFTIHATKSGHQHELFHLKIDILFVFLTDRWIDVIYIITLHTETS
jgi:hypothetical protein